jgi:hypothetical protein
MTTDLKLYEDGILLYHRPATGAPVVPPDPGPGPGPDPGPVEPPPGGTPSAIVPRWPGWWNAVYPNGFYSASGQVRAFEVPAEAGMEKVTFTLGQMPASPPNTKMELSLSRTPGVIEETPGRYLKFTFNNMASLAIFHRASMWETPDSMKAYPEPGPWYLNMRWTYDPPPSGINPGAHSLQWNW